MSDVGRRLDRLNVGCLQPLRTLGDLEAHTLALLEGLVAILGDLREVDEDVVALLPLDEAEALLIAEPLHGAFWHDCPSRNERSPNRGTLGEPLVANTGATVPEWSPARH